MREPNMEQVVVMLANDDYAGRVFDMPNPNERIGWLLYYLQEEQKEMLFHCICGLTEKKQKDVFKSLVALYPLSRSIVMHILQRAAGDLSDFVQTFDPDEMVLNRLAEMVQAVTENTDKTSRTLKEYREDIENLKGKKEQIQKELDEKREARKELRDLELEIDRLKEELTENSVTEESLRAEIQEKKEACRAAKESVERSRRELVNAAEELKKIDEMSGQAADKMPEEYRKALEAVQKAIRDLG